MMIIKSFFAAIAAWVTVYPFFMFFVDHYFKKTSTGWFLFIGSVIGLPLTAYMYSYIAPWGEASDIVRTKDLYAHLVLYLSMWAGMMNIMVLIQSQTLSIFKDTSDAFSDNKKKKASKIE